jgi:hypothetical protein
MTRMSPRRAELCHYSRRVSLIYYGASILKCPLVVSMRVKSRTVITLSCDYLRQIFDQMLEVAYEIIGVQG